MKAPNIDNMEVARFAAMADHWWDRNGSFKALHDINPVRMAYVRDRAGMRDKNVLDVGCGGGLLTEAMAAAGATVTGIDASPSALSAAGAHMGQSGMKVTYLNQTAAGFADTIEGQFDIVTCMELLEHVPDPASVINACARLAHPDGDLFFATVNRTWAAYLLVIIAAEYVFGIVRKGTHTYRKFVRPGELAAWGQAAGLHLSGTSGLRYIPFGGYCSLSRDTSMNYLMHFTRKG